MNDKVISKEEIGKNYRLETGLIRNETNTGNVASWVMLTHIETGKRYFGIDISQVKAKEKAVMSINAPIELDSKVKEWVKEYDWLYNQDFTVNGWHENGDIEDLNGFLDNLPIDTIRTALSDKDKIIELTNDMAQKQQENDKKAFKHMQFISQGHLDKLNAIEAVATISDENYRKYSNGDKLNTILQILRRDNNEQDS